MPRPSLTIVALALLAACSNHSSPRSSAARDAAPPLRSDRDVFESTTPVVPDSPHNGGGSGAGGGNGRPGVGIGNGGGGGRGSTVPEPGTILLVGAGLAAAALSRRKRKTEEPA